MTTNPAEGLVSMYFLLWSLCFSHLKFKRNQRRLSDEKWNGFKSLKKEVQLPSAFKCSRLWLRKGNVGCFKMGSGRWSVNDWWYRTTLEFIHTGVIGGLLNLAQTPKPQRDTTWPFEIEVPISDNLYNRYNSLWVATLPTTLTLYFRKKEIIEKDFGGKQKISNNILFRYDVFYLIYGSLSCSVY